MAHEDIPTVLIYGFMLLAVAVFAASGALAAGRRKLDVIGVVVLAMVTATGGGTARDVLLDRHPIFWIADPTFIIVCLAATAVTWVWVRYYAPPDRALIYADAIGLAFSAVSGAQVAENLQMPGLIIVLMGTITGCAGGLMRDVLTAQIPLIFRKSELYVTTCIAGLVAYVLLRKFGIGAPVSGSIGAAIILALRLASIRWHITLPEMHLGKDNA
ncbi:MAG: trimeric intracellular cation channel family protein [Rhodospirillaceae bacterium]|nr:trimeric intracellular cation channel family protein [Rhodospirillaceae bacterium]